eukprot:SAG31_NODE_904_length_11120_cov_76.575084_5_plen_110_part_00
MHVARSQTDTAAQPVEEGSGGDIGTKVRLLQNVPDIFDGVPIDTMQDLARAMQWVTAPLGKAIVAEGEAGDAMYIVGKGTLQAQISDVGVVKTYAEGGYFGEQVRLLAQ